MSHSTSRLQQCLLFCITGVAAVLFYLWRSLQVYSMGFPLDDAWIHQTYARNLAISGQWFFQAGAPSTGSTAPLWTCLLVPGYLIKVSPEIWSAVLGTLLLISTAWMAFRWLELRMEPAPALVIISGLVVLLDWHLLWAAVSGMETLAACFLVIAFFYLLEGSPQKPFLLGTVIGLGVWIRPDLITLLLPLAAATLLKWKDGIRSLIAYLFSVAAGLCVFVVPYLWVNKVLSDAWWPSTFYAKQAEYAVLRTLPLGRRILRQFSQPLIGAGGILLPGILINVGYTLRRKKWYYLAPHLWVLAYLTLFAAQLPVTYQHGRYAMPVVAVVLSLGMSGFLSAIRWNANQFFLRIASRVWAVSGILVLLVFVLKGSQVFAQDVAIIESEMVVTANWITKNTAKDDLIAAHDIGAIGYFSERKLLDLAGLISPEVIPILRSEPDLAVYMDENEVDYLVTFPEWYPDLTASAELVFHTDTDYSVDAGGENMAVYRWDSAAFAP
ncbi:MAG: hypothetical protein JXA25_03560 [Anaerolineales bacterium]|nr:hypothetical protein [Anaerolineales bacterium]